jgi:hypothetical protein
MSPALGVIAASTTVYLRPSRAVHAGTEWRWALAGPALAALIVLVLVWRNSRRGNE